jgi:hypothetical protein
MTDTALLVGVNSGSATGSWNTCSGLPALNQWSHIAICRSGTSLRCFLNGSSILDTTNSADVDNSDPQRIGYWRNTTPFDGYMDEIRFSNTARYTANFTPTTSAFTDDSNTLLLLHMDGADGSTSFTDDANNDNLGMLIEEARTNQALHTEDFTQINGSSNTSATANQITAPDGTTTAERINATSSGSGFHSTPSGDIASGNTYTYSVFAKAGTTSFVQISLPGLPYPSPTGYANFSLSGSGSVGDSSSIIESTSIESYGNGWYRCSVTATSNGNQTGSGVNIIPVASSTTSLTTVVNGDNIFVWGKQVEIGAFPTSYIKTTSASVTRSQDFASMSKRDSVAVSANGDAQVSTAQSKFGGASAEFDGTGDSLSVTGNSAVDLSGDFTIELFVRHVNASGNQKYLDLRQIGNESTTDVLLIDTNNNFRIFIDGSDRLSGGAGAPSINTWYHIAVVRNGTSIKYFLDGTEELDYTQSSPKDYTLDYNWVIAMNGDDRNKDFLNGYIDELRISNTARYTANFTAPTSAFTNDANTLLLLHMDGANGSTEFIDDNPPITNYSATQGTVQIDATILGEGDTTANVFGFIDDSAKTTDSIGIIADTSATEVDVLVEDGNVSQASMTGVSYTIGTSFSAALGFKANDFAFSVNNATASTDASGTLPSGIDKAVFFGDVNGQVNEHSGIIKTMNYYNTKLTTAQIEGL